MDIYKEVPFLRYYNVFHIDQCEGLTAKHMPQMPATANADEKEEETMKGEFMWDMGGALDTMRMIAEAAAWDCGKHHA